MSKDKEISATAKLLEIIRSEGDSTDPTASQNKDQPQDDIEIVTDIAGPELHIDSQPIPSAQPSPSDLNKTITLDLEQDETEPVLILELEDAIPPSPSSPESKIPLQDTSKNQPLELDSKDSDIKMQDEGTKGDDDDDDDDIKSLSGKFPTKEEQGPLEKSGIKLLLSSFSNLKISKKKKIGIDIQPRCINIARLDHGKQQAESSNYIAIELPRQDEKENGPFFISPTVTETLSASLSLFCEGAKSPEIWCTFKSDRCKILNVIIPKIAESEVPNAVLWATKKEVDVDLAEYVFDYKKIKEIEDGKLKKIITLVYLFHKDEIQGVKSMFKKIGYPLTGITHSSSAIQNILQKNEAGDKDVATVHLSFEKPASNIDVYFKNELLFTREIKTGITSYIESIFDLAGEKDLILDDQTVGRLAFDSAKSLIYPEVKENIAESATLIDITKISTHERSIRQLSRTFDFCSSNFKIPRVSKLFNSGKATLKKPLLDMIQSELDVECAVINIFSADPNRQKAIETLPNAPENLNPTTAFGLALANNANTQNFLFTYADKTRHLQEARSNQLISIVTVILAIILGSVSFFYYQDLQGKQKEINTLHKGLEKKYAVEPRSKDTTFALSTTNKIESIIRETNDKASRFRVIALVNDITSQAPDKIKLTELAANLPGNSNDNIHIKGFVKGAVEKQNFVLLHFQRTLVDLFSVSSVQIIEKEDIIYQKNPILKFSMSITLNKGILK